MSKNFDPLFPYSMIPLPPPAPWLDWLNWLSWFDKGARRKEEGLHLFSCPWPRGETGGKNEKRPTREQTDSSDVNVLSEREL